MADSHGVRWAATMRAMRTAGVGVALLLGLASLAPTALAQTGGSDCPPQPQALSPQHFTAAQQQARDRGFLWQVSKGGHSSYLYGTLHVGRDNWLAAGPALAQALRASTTLALELDPLDPELGVRMGQALALAPVRPMAAETRERLLQQMRLQCMPEESVAQVPAELLLAGLALNLARRAGLDAQFGSEVFLSLTARASGMPVVSLETVELQLQALLAADATEAAQMLADGLKELESGHAREGLMELVSMWESGDVQRLDTYEQWCACVVTPMQKLQMQRLLEGRNPAMADRMDAMHRSGLRVFAAVGSLHMSGPRGLPALLVQMGYEIKRLP